MQPSDTKTGTTMPDPRKSLYVSFHDITPVFLDPIRRIIDAIAPLIGNNWAAAVVPQWHGEPVDSYGDRFIDTLRSSFGELLLHGYYHERQRGKGALRMLTNGADEFNGLTVEETEQRLTDGQRVMKQLFGESATGFIAPTFQPGRLTTSMLARHGIRSLIGFARTEFSDGRRLPLNTWCWDVGDNRTLCRASDRFSTIRQWFHPRSMPHLTIHPPDVERGFLDRIVSLLQRLLDDGRQPIVMGRFAPDSCVATG